MKPTILITAYAVNPYKGSEDGTGWNLILQAAKKAEVIAITRRNNQVHIDKYKRENINCYSRNIQFYYFDLPKWFLFWKKGTAGALLYFYLWQITLPIFVWYKQLNFTIVHNLNFHNDWIPTFLWVFGKPLIWGPIGHHPAIPTEYILTFYGTKAFLIDRAFHYIKNAMRVLNPFMYLALWKSNYILSVNSSVCEKFPWLKEKIISFPAVGGNYIQNVNEHKIQKTFTVLSAGRFESIKGFDITIKAFELFYSKLTNEERQHVELKLAGSGKYSKKLQILANLGNSAQHIIFLDWVPKDEINNLYQNASVFFFPSHEGAGMVIPEALSHGLPVICFANNGPGELIDKGCGLTVQYSNYQESILQFSNHLYSLFKSYTLQKALSEGAVQRFHQNFDWNIKGNKLNTIYTLTLQNYEKKYSVCSLAK